MLKKKKYAKNVADDQGPDWGDLKHVDRPEGEAEEGAKSVSFATICTHFPLIYLINTMYYSCYIENWSPIVNNLTINSLLKQTAKRNSVATETLDGFPRLKPVKTLRRVMIL